MAPKATGSLSPDWPIVKIKPWDVDDLDQAEVRPFIRPRRLPEAPCS